MPFGRRAGFRDDYLRVAHHQITEISINIPHTLLQVSLVHSEKGLIKN